jgi:hypothetical protein
MLSMRRDIRPTGVIDQSVKLPDSVASVAYTGLHDAVQFGAQQLKFCWQLAVGSHRR